MRRRLLFALLVAAIVHPCVGGANAAEQRGVGTAETNVQLLRASIEGLPNGSGQIDLGDLAAAARTQVADNARLALTALRAGGQELGAFEVTSDSGTRSGDHSVPLGDGPLAGSVTLGDYLVRVADGTATAQLQALDVEGTVGALVRLTAAAATGLVSEVTPTGSRSAMGLTVGGLDLAVGDLLPGQLLDLLPLDAVIDLAGVLGLPVDPALAGFQSQLADLGVALGDLGDAQAALTAAVDALPALEQAVTDATADLAEVDAVIAAPTLDGVTALVEGHPACGVEVDPADLPATLDALRVCVDQALTDAQDALDVALAEVPVLQDAVIALLDALQGLLDALPDISGLLDDLTLAIAGAPLLSVDDLRIVVSTSADAARGQAEATCRAGALAVAGQTVAAPTCDAIGGALGGVVGLVQDVLGALPIAGGLPAVSVAGPVARTSASPAPNANGVTSAAASLTALELSIAGGTLTDLLDTVLADARAALDAVLAAVPELPVDLLADLEALDGVLAGLPLGDLLDGIPTLGLSVAAGSLRSATMFTTSQATTTTTTAAPTPTTAPPTPRPVSTLPATGSNTPAAIAVGLLCLVSGELLRTVAERQQARAAVRATR